MNTKWSNFEDIKWQLDDPDNEIGEDGGGTDNSGQTPPQNT